jgi:hypothetical protein
VIDGPQSVVWDEAENRLHVQKAILAWCLGGGRLGAKRASGKGSAAKRRVADKTTKGRTKAGRKTPRGAKR